MNVENTHIVMNNGNFPRPAFGFKLFDFQPDSAFSPRPKAAPMEDHFDLASIRGFEIWERGESIIKDRLAGVRPSFGKPKGTLELGRIPIDTIS